MAGNDSARKRSAKAKPTAAQRSASQPTIAANKARVRRFVFARGRIPTPGELSRIVKRK